MEEMFVYVIMGQRGYGDESKRFIKQICAELSTALVVILNCCRAMKSDYPDAVEVRVTLDELSARPVLEAKDKSSGEVVERYWIDCHKVVP